MSYIFPKWGVYKDLRRKCRVQLIVAAPVHVNTVD